MTDWPANMPKPTWESKDGSVLLYHGDCLDILPQLPDACVASHRRCVGVERRPDYFDIAVRRIEEAFDSQALFRQDEQREPDPELFEAANDSAKNVAERTQANDGLAREHA